MVTNSFICYRRSSRAPPDAPKPTKLEQFCASHPNAPKAIGSLPIPDSFADEEYQEVVVPNAGHWLMEEAPAATIAAVRGFLAAH